MSTAQTAKKIDFIDLVAQQSRIRKQIDERIRRVLDHGQYILGPEVTELESKLAQFVGVKEALSMASGTDALLIALMALGVGPGDEVITTPFTFISTAEVIALLQAKPVFVDIDEKTFNINPVLIEKAVTKKTKAIIPVSLYGQCANMEAINEIAKKHNIPVIEDGCQSFGSTRHGKQSCSLSTIGCTSFFPSKPLGGYGDGGACFTNDPALAQKMKWIRVHGQDKRYHHPLIGVNGRFDTLQAAILLPKLEIFPEEVTLRAKIGERYTQLLKGVVGTPATDAGNTHVYAQYTVRVKNRASFQESLNKAGVPTAVHYPIPLHLQPAFSYLNYKEGSLPVSELCAREVVSLPMHPYLSSADQDRIVEAVKLA